MFRKHSRRISRFYVQPDLTLIDLPGQNLPDARDSGQLLPDLHKSLKSANSRDSNGNTMPSSVGGSFLPNPHALQITDQKVGYDGDPQPNMVDSAFQPLVQNGKGIHIAVMPGEDPLRSTGKLRRIVILQDLLERLTDRCSQRIANGTFPRPCLIPAPNLGGSPRVNTDNGNVIL